MQSLRAACETARLSDRFVLMNDDFFVMREIDSVPVFHGPTVRKHHDWFLARGKSPDSPYLDGIRKTLAEVESWGIKDPLTYERHSPLPMNKRRLGTMLAMSQSRPFLWQTAYAVIAENRGVYGPDAKNDSAKCQNGTDFGTFLTSTPFLSSWDGSFKNGPIGKFVREAFPRPCRYELPRTATGGRGSV